MKKAVMVLVMFLMAGGFLFFDNVKAADELQAIFHSMTFNNPFDYKGIDRDFCFNFYAAEDADNRVLALVWPNAFLNANEPEISFYHVDTGFVATMHVDAPKPKRGACGAMPIRLEAAKTAGFYNYVRFFVIKDDNIKKHLINIYNARAYIRELIKKYNKKFNSEDAADEADYKAYKSKVEAILFDGIPEGERKYDITSPEGIAYFLGKYGFMVWGPEATPYYLPVKDLNMIKNLAKVLPINTTDRELYPKSGLIKLKQGYFGKTTVKDFYEEFKKLK